MDRRHFLKLLGIGAVTAATPKIIFDMGKNLHLYEPQIHTVQWPIKFKFSDRGLQGNEILEGNEEYLYQSRLYFNGVLDQQQILLYTLNGLTWSEEEQLRVKNVS